MSILPTLRLSNLHRHSGALRSPIILAVFTSLCLAASPAQTDAKAASQKAEKAKAGTQSDCLRQAKKSAVQGLGMNMNHSGMYMLNEATGPAAIVDLTRTDPPGPPKKYPEGIGKVHKEVPGGADTQEYFDQGLRFYYAFNNRESYRAFRYAANVANGMCSMCYIGQALALGPDINMSQELEPDRDAAKVALINAKAALEQDRKTIDPREVNKITVLIDALTWRFKDCPHTPLLGFDCQTWRNCEYQRAVAAHFNDYHDDPDYVVLFADAAMNQVPWGYWEPDGEPKTPAIAQAKTAIKQALPKYPEHEGLVHWDIHLMEMSKEPQSALESANKLAGLAPKAGHLVHMPSHIYYRLGIMDKSIRANQDAVARDQEYFRDDGLKHPDGDRYRFGYYPHNIHFAVASADLIGEQPTVDKAAETLLQAAPQGAEAYRADQYKAVYYLARMNLAETREIAGFPAPRDKQNFAAVAYNYARVFAAILDKNTSERDAYYKNLEGAIETYRNAAVKRNVECIPEQFLPSDLNLCIIRIMSDLARARVITSAAGEASKIIELLRDAEAVQRKLPYDEPPRWLYPVSQTFAGLMLWKYHEGDRSSAMIEYMGEARQRLERSLKESQPLPSGVFLGNAWAYYGLWKIKEILGEPDSKEYQKKFIDSWAGCTEKGCTEPDFRRM